MSSSTAILELLDGPRGYALQAWPLHPGGISQIGRSPDVEVVIRNPYVSRSHAYIQCESGHWRIGSLSDGGLLINGERFLDAELQDGIEFRLSRKGPILRFHLSAPEHEFVGGMETMQLDALDTPLLMVDTRIRDGEVAQIEQQEYFKDLQRLAGELRRRRGVPE